MDLHWFHSVVKASVTLASGCWKSRRGTRTTGVWRFPAVRKGQFPCGDRIEAGRKNLVIGSIQTGWCDPWTWSQPRC